MLRTHLGVKPRERGYRAEPLPPCRALGKPDRLRCQLPASLKLFPSMPGLIQFMAADDGRRGTNSRKQPVVVTWFHSADADGGLRCGDMTRKRAAFRAPHSRRGAFRGSSSVAISPFSIGAYTMGPGGSTSAV